MANQDEQFKKQQEIQNQLTREASNMHIVNVKGNAYRIRSNGNIIETDNASKVQRLRACFTLHPNNMVKSGEKEFFIQFINPNGNVVPDMTSLMSSNKLKFSKKTIVLYQNETLEVCDFISVAEDQLIPGQYKIQIYYNQQVVSSSTFELK